jgi:predicted flap endonuclease-1-like 5' DNA nuclease
LIFKADYQNEKSGDQNPQKNGVDPKNQTSRKLKFINTMANYKIEEIEGIGPVIGDKLRQTGINSTDKLLENTKTSKQRKNLVEATGISEKLILKFANMADLFRIHGLGQEYTELLEAAGVDTVPELAQRNAENLAVKLEEVNAEKKLTRRVPSLKEVEQWVVEAKKLPRVLEY